MFTIYGAYYPNDHEERQREKEYQERRFDYLKAKIVAEQLNPNFSFENRFQLLVEIAKCNCNYYQRNELIKLLNPEPSDADE